MGWHPESELFENIMKSEENRISNFQRGDVVEGAVDRARVGVPPHLPPRGLAVRRGPTAGQAQEVVQGRKWVGTTTGLGIVVQ